MYVAHSLGSLYPVFSRGPADETNVKSVNKKRFWCTSACKAECFNLEAPIYIYLETTIIEATGILVRNTEIQTMEMIDLIQMKPIMTKSQIASKAVTKKKRV
jgi:hypothetical protein